MSTTTAKKPAPKQATRKPATTPAKTAPAPKAKASTPAPAPKPKAKESKPAPKTLIEALTTGQAVLLKLRANGTKRSLPYYAEGSEYRVLGHAAATMKANGDTVEAIAKELKVSLATARRFLTGLA